MDMSLNLGSNHFELFGLPARFDVPMDQVDAAYRRIQGEVHPDRFAHAGEAERRMSMQWATRINEAYQTLKSPLKRGIYLLELQGIDPGMESNTAMPADFLMEQMEWREAAEEAEDSADVEQLDELLRKLRADMKTHYGELEQQIDAARDWDGATQTVRKLMFLERLQRELNHAIADLED